MLKARQIFFEYGDHHVLKGVDAEVQAGEVVSIVGPNGVGKTTLLRCIAGIVRPSKGDVRINGKALFNMDRRELARFVSYMPQSSAFRFPATVYDAILAGRRPYFAWRPSRRDLEKVDEIIEALDLTGLAMKDMDQLSGGQRQKVLLARALVQDTHYLLLDEPNAGLDLRHQLELLEIVAGLSDKRNIGVIMAMHDLNLAARFSHMVMMLHHGKIRCKGPPTEVITVERIREIYGVEAVIARSNGYLHIQVLHCARENAAAEKGHQRGGMYE